MNFELSIINGKTVSDVIRAQRADCLDVVRDAYWSFVTGTLVDAMLGGQSVNRSRPVIFSPFGMGILDVVVGKWVYDRAVAAGQDQRLTDFFYETVR